MNYNISDILEKLDVEETERITDSIKINQSDADINAIKSRVISKAEIAVRENGNKNRKLSVKAMIALAAAVAIVLCSATVAARMYFKPESSLNRIFTFDDNADSLASLGWDVNAVSESNGISLKLTQVMSDDRSLFIAFDCPEKDGVLLIPEPYIKISFNGREMNYGNDCCYSKNGSYIMTIANLDNDAIPNNTKVNIEINKLGYYYDVDSDEIVEALLSNGAAPEEIEQAIQDGTYSDFAAKVLGMEKETVDGSWSFEFTTIETNAKKSFEYDGLIALSSYGSPFRITRAEVSPFGVYLEFSDEDAAGDVPEVNEERLVVEMKDGTVYTDFKDSLAEGSVMSWHGIGNGKFEGNMHMYFKNIVNVDDIKSISLAGIVIYEG